MSNPMADANVSIINDLKKFLSSVTDDASERERYVFLSTSFQRKRVLTLSLVVLLIINFLKKSLSIELSNFFFCLLPEKSCSKQAFCEQRAKLKPTFFHDWNKVFVSSFYHHYSEMKKTWNGLTVWAVDGSTIPLPQTEALRTQFGGATNQSENAHNVTARVCLVSDILNDIVIAGGLHSYFSSEEDACVQILENMNIENKLLIFDRGYPSFWLEYWLMQKGVKFLMRVKKNENNQIVQFLNSDATDTTTLWYPSYRSLKKLQSMGFEVDRQTSIPMRMVKVVLETGETEVLITNLYDTQVYCLDSLKEAYHFRWGIETHYGHLKEKLQMGQFSGIRQICIEQDFAANLLMYNLQSLIEKQTEPYVETVNQKRKHQWRVNKNVALGMMKNRVIRLFTENDSSGVLRELEKLFGNCLEPVRPGRKYPRIFKRKPHGKHYTLTNYKRAV
jgi:hypothetical protein